MARGARMRCAECQHRWMPTADAAADGLSLEPLMSEPALPPPPPPPPPVPEPTPLAEQIVADDNEEALDDDALDDDASPRRRSAWRWIIALLFGLVLAAAAGALWIARTDPDRIPALAPLLARLQAEPSPLRADVTGIVTRLPSGERLIEITGHVRNPGPGRESIKGVDARLSSGSGTARRWRINVPVRTLGPGESASFASTATGFSADAVILSVTPIP